MVWFGLVSYYVDLVGTITDKSLWSGACTWVADSSGELRAPSSVPRGTFDIDLAGRPPACVLALSHSHLQSSEPAHRILSLIDMAVLSHATKLGLCTIFKCTISTRYPLFYPNPANYFCSVKRQ